MKIGNERYESHVGRIPQPADMDTRRIFSVARKMHIVIILLEMVSGGFGFLDSGPRTEPTTRERGERMRR